MHTWMDLVAIAMVCVTAIICAGLMVVPPQVDKDDDKKA